jgi:sugar fermentation stimulation protein A
MRFASPLIPATLIRRYKRFLADVQLGSDEKITAHVANPGAMTGLDLKYGKSSRIDFLLESVGRPPCYVEIKNVHLMRSAGLAEFPDCITARGAKHLDELAAMAANGARAVMLFVIQIGSSKRFSLARDIDAAYGAAFDRARDRGVEVIAWKCAIGRAAIEVAEQVPIVD